MSVPAVLHTIHSLDADHGGPSRTVPSLCEAVARTGRFRVFLLTTVRPDRRNLLPDPALVSSFEIDDGGLASLLWHKRFETAAVEICRRERIALLHDHGQWLSTNRAAASAARRLGLPRVVSPRGMLSPWALRHRRLLKWAAWTAFGRRDLASAAAVHATSDLERDELLDLGVTHPVSVVPNGIAFDEGPRGAKADSPREALFLSRLHPKKGLPELIEAWARVRPANWRLVIAGPDEGGHRIEVERIARAKGLDGEVSFAGPVEGAAKNELYDRASLFVLPSRSENFGVVVAEALAAETPVITTTATPWGLLEEHGCGWWIAPNVNSLEHALRTAVSLPSPVLREIGCRGRSVVMSRFRWEGIGRTMADVYESLTERKPTSGVLTR